jgi:ATP-binding protein involved in chromosome partitioning
MSGDVFGHGGGDALAGELGVPLLAEIPLDPALRTHGDEGVPLVVADPDAPTSRAIAALADAIDATRRDEGVGIVKSLPVLS